MRSKIITALDIGTTFIKSLTVLEKPDSQSFEILSRIKIPNFGMRKGVVAKPEEVSQKIVSVLEEAEKETGHRIKDVYVNIGGSHLFLASSKGSVVISRVDRSISQEDIDRSVDTAKVLSLPPNKEVIYFFPKQFIVDGVEGIKEPLGMKGIRLETEILSVCAFSPYFKNLTEACLDADVQISDVICNPIASANACLTPRQKELGAVLLDIGGGTTDFAVYEEGDLIHLGVIPIGSEHVTNDIAIGLRTDTKIAEEIKKEFGRCNPSRINKPKEGSSKKSRKRGKIEVPLASLSFSEKFLTKIIEARVSEIFNLVQKEIKKVSSGILPAGVIITGGSAKLPNIVDLAKKELKLPCRIGLPIVKQGEIEESEFLGENEKDPSFSTAWGLILSGMSDDESEGRFSLLEKGIMGRIKKIIKTFIP